MAEVAARLGLGDAHVVFGHTHRAGPLPGEPQAEWRGRSGARLMNSGSWIYEPIFLADPRREPLLAGDVRARRGRRARRVLRRLLSDRGHEELAASRTITVE